MQHRVQPGGLECSLGAATWELSCSLGAAVRLESCHAAWELSCSLGAVMRPAVPPESCQADRELSHSMLSCTVGAATLHGSYQPGNCRAVWKLSCSSGARLELCCSWSAALELSRRL